MKSGKKAQSVADALHRDTPNFDERTATREQVIEAFACGD
jgi:hypothetical protein